MDSANITNHISESRHELIEKLEGEMHGEIRHRDVKVSEAERKNEDLVSSEVESDDDRANMLESNIAKTVSQGTDHTPSLLSSVLSGLPPRIRGRYDTALFRKWSKLRRHLDVFISSLGRAVIVTFVLGMLQITGNEWRNWVIRGIFTWLMIGGFCVIIWIGPLALMFTTLLVQVWCFKEIINIGYTVYKVHGLPWFRSLSWWFLITSNYFFYGESLVSDYFGIIFSKSSVLRFLINYHRFISFTMYIIGFVWFVLSLKKKYYMRQFSLFAWTHVALLIVVTQSYLIIINIFQGMIWFIVPVSMIVINDVMAYMFGFFFGKTPLIQLSPKKTWEGFIGGGISTVILGMMLSYVFCLYSFFVCSVSYSESDDGLKYDCDPSPIFHLQEYNLPETLGNLSHLLGFKRAITMYPFVFHSVALSMFSSVIGPFGGFFASGFKRAFKIKDFGDVIPGHGGVMDRFDCQFLMATFVNVYIWSFIEETSPQKLLQKIYMLSPDQQLQLYNMLHDSLNGRGILQLA